MKTDTDFGFKPLILLGLCIFLCYSNTLSASWQFDDYQNIVNNSRIHLDDINFHSVMDSFFSGTDNRFYRPLPCFSFALNWYFGKNNVFGYHLINIIIHIITAFTLFHTLMLLSISPKMRPIFRREAYSVCLLATVLWAVHPIQTQAVTYIVQRMTLMSGMFYVAGIFFYIKARLSLVRLKRILFYFICFSAYIFALLSKENAAMLPFGIILVELIFFSHDPFSKIRKILTLKITLFLILLLGIIFTYYFLLSDNLYFLYEGYNVRPFNMTERLLTETRVILKYFFQILYPADSLYSVEHNINISKSLLIPWTTLLSILINLMIIFGAATQYKKMPTFSFAVLFFYLNHIIESTFIPLELIFEHRNYIPTLFLFFPISQGFIYLITKLKKSSWIIRYVFSVSVIFLIFLLCLSTYTRNQAWKTEKSLWEDVLLKYPDLSRPYQKLAGYYKNRGYEDLALKLYEKALPLDHPAPDESRYVCLNNMANIYLSKDEYQKAIDLYRQALPLTEGEESKNAKYFNNQISALFYNMAYAYLKAGEYHSSEIICDRMIKTDPFHIKFLELKAFLLIKRGQTNEAQIYLQKALTIAPNHFNLLLYSGYAYKQSGEFGHSLAVFQKARKLYPNNMVLLFFMIENSIVSRDPNNQKKYTEFLFKNFTLSEIEDGIDDLKKYDPTKLSLFTRDLEKAVSAYLFEILKMYESSNASF